jgi:hypothetical protein
MLSARSYQNLRDFILVIVYRSLAVKWSDRYTFVNIIAVGVEFIDMFAKMKSIMSLVYVKFNCLRNCRTITLPTFLTLLFRFKAIFILPFLLILDYLAAS